MPLTEKTREAAARLVARYPLSRSALLPLLHLVQSDHGYVSDEGVAFCAEQLGLTKAEVGAVASFYTMFKREPVGDWLLSVCTNPVCKIAGGQEIYEGYRQRCGGSHRSEQGTVTVEHAECLGICDGAPAVQVNYEMYGPVTVDDAMALFDACAKGEPPASTWSNERPGTFKQVEWDLSGAGDGTDEYLIAAARAQAGAEVAPSRRSGETDIPVTHPGGDPKGVGGSLVRAAQEGVDAGGPSTHGGQGADAAGWGER
ncbi:MAG TPA: NAD(P)H-dependent oxidoreductase subunit E [Nitriliruptorales bacterium]